MRSKSKTDYEKSLTERILALQLSVEDAKSVVARIPFLNTGDRLSLMRMIESRRLETFDLIRSGEDTKPGWLSLGDDRERLTILKKFLLSKIHTEEDYEKIQDIFHTPDTSLNLLPKVKELTFLTNRDIEVVEKIVQGQFEAWFHRDNESDFRHSQILEVSSVTDRGFAMDLPSRSGDSTRILHQMRSSGTWKGQEWSFEMGLEAGDRPLRKEDDYQLENFLFQMRGDQHSFFLGDQMPELGSMVLNREVRGIGYEFARKSSVPSRFGVLSAYSDVSIQDIDSVDFERMLIQSLYYVRKPTLDREWTFALAWGSRHQNLNGDGLVFGVSHETKLFRNSRLNFSLNSSLGDPGTGIRSSAFAYDLDFCFNDSEHVTDLEFSHFGRDWVSFFGESEPGSTRVFGQYARNLSWGRYWGGVEAGSSPGYISAVSSESLRPMGGIRFLKIFGVRDFHGEYNYMESREEAEDLSRLYESNTHEVLFSKGFHRVEMEVALSHRKDWDKLLSMDNSMENQARFASRGWFLFHGKKISPEMWVMQRTLKDPLGQNSRLDSAGVRFSGDFISQSRFFVQWAKNESHSLSAYSLSAGESFEARLEAPFADLRKTLALEYKWLNQQLSTVVSDGSRQELTLSFQNSF